MAASGGSKWNIACACGYKWRQKIKHSMCLWLQVETSNETVNVCLWLQVETANETQLIIVVWQHVPVPASGDSKWNTVNCCGMTACACACKWRQQMKHSYLLWYDSMCLQVDTANEKVKYSGMTACACGCFWIQQMKQLIIVVWQHVPVAASGYSKWNTVDCSGMTACACACFWRQQMKHS